MKTDAPIGASTLREDKFADNQPVDSQGQDQSPVQDEYSRFEGITAKARRVHARVHLDAQEAEFGPP